MRAQLFSALALTAIHVLSSCTQQQEIKPLSGEEIHLPENALHGLKVAQDLEVQLFAHEPMIINPTNMDIDDRGRIWVTEGRNYRPRKNEDNPYIEEGDQILILEDTDGDGKADNRKVFYQGVDINVALGICVLDNKVIVSSAPDVFILTDEDGDDKADSKELLFTGIRGRQNEHSVHAVVFGPDGKLYFNFGNAGRQIADKDGNAITDIFGNEVNDKGHPYRHGMAFRCNMDGSEFEVLGWNFRNNYELAVDSYGNVWQSDNDDDGNKACRINYVMEYGNFGYRDELTGAAWLKPRVGMHRQIPKRHWHQNDPGVVPNLFITGSGSPAGITVYEGQLLPRRYHSQLIHAEAGPGITHAYLKTKDGAGFKAEKVNMLVRTTDPWHRPSDVAVAPDGSLFSADWYDAGVGGNLSLDPYKGRIFRLVPKAGSYTFDAPDYSTPESAADALKSPNAATRYKAWTRLNGLGERAENVLVELWNDSNPIYRARALWLLTKIYGKESQHIAEALIDANPDIRIVGIRAARQSTRENLQTALATAVNDANPQVRREVALALRNLNDVDQIAELWTKLALQHGGEDRWYIEALGIGAAMHWDDCFNKWIEEAVENWKQKPGRDIVWRSRASKSLEYQLALLQDPSLPLDEVARLLRATDFQIDANKNQKLAALLNIKRSDQNEFNRMVLNQLDPLFAANSSYVKKAATEILPGLYGRSTYLDLVINLDLQEESDNVFRLLLEKPNHELGVRAARIVFAWKGVAPFKSVVENDDEEAKRAVVENLGHVHNDDGRELLNEVARDENQSVSLRRLAVENLARGGGWEERMIYVLESGALSDELKAVAATKLLGANKPIDREAGRKFLNLQETSEEWPAISELAAKTGNIESGMAVFKEACSTCHRVSGEGIAFGPDLTEIGNKLGKEAILVSIIKPNAGISFGFEGEQIQTNNGKTFAGYVTNETAAGIDLRIMGGINQSFSKDEITSRKLIDYSLMTPNLHSVIGQEKLLDLVEYVASLKNYKTLHENPYQGGKIEYEREESE